MLYIAYELGNHPNILIISILLPPLSTPGIFIAKTKNSSKKRASFLFAHPLLPQSSLSVVSDIPAVPVVYAGGQDRVDGWVEGWTIGGLGSEWMGGQVGESAVGRFCGWAGAGGWAGRWADGWEDGWGGCGR